MDFNKSACKQTLSSSSNSDVFVNNSCKYIDEQNVSQNTAIPVAPNTNQSQKCNQDSAVTPKKKKSKRRSRKKKSSAAAKESSEVDSLKPVNGDKLEVSSPSFNEPNELDKSWIGDEGANPQPHTVEILGLEALQQQIDDYKHKAKKKNKKELLREESFTLENPDATMEPLSASRNSGFHAGNGDGDGDLSTLIVSPEDLLMNEEGKFIGNLNLKEHSCSEEEYPSHTAVAPDKLSECEFTCSDVDSVCSNSFYNEDREFYDAQKKSARDELENVGPTPCGSVDDPNTGCNESGQNDGIVFQSRQSNGDNKPEDEKKKSKKNRKRGKAQKNKNNDPKKPTDDELKKSGRERMQYKPTKSYSIQQLSCHADAAKYIQMAAEVCLFLNILFECSLLYHPSFFHFFSLLISFSIIIMIRP